MYELATETREKEMIKSKEVDADDISVGSIVYRKRHPLEKIHKLDYRYDGPYKVVVNCGNGSYKISDMRGRVKAINRRHLKPCVDIVFDFEEGDMWTEP